METNVNLSERKVNEITKDLLTVKKVKKDKKPAKSENQKLIDEIKKMNISEVTKKTTGSKALYKKESKLKYGDGNEKTGRRKIRNLGIEKSNTLLSAIITGSKVSEAKKDLSDFYNEVLINFDNFSNERKKPEIWDKLRKAHLYLKLNK